MRIAIIFLVLFLAACAYPSLSYYEWDDAIANAETPEEKAYYEKKLERFEKTAMEAEQYITAWLICAGPSTRCIMVCKYHGIKPEGRIERVLKYDLVRQVRWYRAMRSTCKFNFRRF